MALVTDDDFRSIRKRYEDIDPQLLINDLRSKGHWFEGEKEQESQILNKREQKMIDQDTMTIKSESIDYLEGEDDYSYTKRREAIEERKEEEQRLSEQRKLVEIESTKRIQEREVQLKEEGKIIGPIQREDRRIIGPIKKIDPMELREEAISGAIEEAPFLEKAAFKAGEAFEEGREAPGLLGKAKGLFEGLALSTVVGFGGVFEAGKEAKERIGEAIPRKLEVNREEAIDAGRRLFAKDTPAAERFTSLLKGISASLATAVAPVSGTVEGLLSVPIEGIAKVGKGIVELGEEGFARYLSSQIGLDLDTARGVVEDTRNENIQGISEKINNNFEALPQWGKDLVSIGGDALDIADATIVGYVLRRPVQELAKGVVKAGTQLKRIAQDPKAKIVDPVRTVLGDIANDIAKTPIGKSLEELSEGAIAAGKLVKAGVKKTLEGIESSTEFLTRYKKTRDAVKLANKEKDIGKMAQEIFQPSPAIAAKNPRILDDILETTNEIKKSKTFDQLITNLSRRKKELGNDIGKLIESNKEKVISSDALLKPLSEKITLLKGDELTKDVATQMEDILTKEIKNLSKITDKAGNISIGELQKRKVKLNEFLAKFLNKADNQLSDIEQANMQALNEVRSSYMKNIANSVPEIEALNRRFGALSTTIPLARRMKVRFGNVLKNRGIFGLILRIPGVKFVKDIIFGRISVDDALFSRAGTIEEELSSLTKKIEKGAREVRGKVIKKSVIKKDKQLLNNIDKD